MGKIGQGLGAFEMMGKTVSFAPLYNSMASIAGQMARVKAEAAKQQRRQEEAAQARVDDFIISDKNQYTQKYLPYAQKAFAELVANIQDDKTNYPNNWMNHVTPRLLQANDKLNWATEQSKAQREIEGKAEEGFMVPQELLAAYKQNLGDVSDIAAMAPALSMYGITVSGKGVISHNLSKPVDIGDEFFKFKQSRAVFDEPVTTITPKASTDGSKFDEIRTEKKIAQPSLNNFKVEAASNKDIRTTFKTRRFNEVGAEFEALKKQMQANPSGPQLSDDQLIELATTQAISKVVDSLPISDVTTSTSREPSGKGLTVNVGGEKYVSPSEAKFTAGVVTSYDRGRGRELQGDLAANIRSKIQGPGGSYVFRDPQSGETRIYKDQNGKIMSYPATVSDVPGFNAQLAHSRRGTNPDRIKQFSDLQSDNLYDPSTMEKIPASELSRVFKEGEIIDYYFINQKVYAKISMEIKSGASLPGINEFLVELKRGHKLDGVGATLATEIGGKKYASMYDYFKGNAPSGGSVQPQGQPSNRTSGSGPRLNPR